MAKRISTIKKELIGTHNFNLEKLDNMSDEEIRAEYERINQEETFENSQEYIFYANEKMVKGGIECIRINGLRRVAEEVIGKIVNEKIPKIEPLDNGDNPIGAYAVLEITFKDKNGELRTFSDAADCRPYYNADGMIFGKYSFANAITRAEARIYRKALNLDTVSAEELMDEEEPNIIAQKQLADSSQKVVIDGYMKNNNFTLGDLLSYINEPIVDNLENLTADSALKILKVAMKEKEEIKKWVNRKA